MFARSSLYENQVLSSNLSKLTQPRSAEVPYFHKVKNTVTKNKIEGTSILKLAMVKRLKVNKNLQKKIVTKNLSKNLSK